MDDKPAAAAKPETSNNNEKVDAETEAVELVLMTTFDLKLK
ncbi:MAG: hypothetical protein QWI73_04685 [Alphaproteobacteria bacterium]|nr:hypothetical protein [Alphaproteobacteria bacterium]